MATTNFVSYSNASTLIDAIEAKFDKLTGALVFRGSVAFANLPSTLTRAMSGYVYNLTDAFTTDSRFIDGAGKHYPAGTDVAVADLTTDSYDAVTPVGNENPHEEGWYEEVSSEYVLTSDTEVESGKTYYEKTTTVNVKFDVGSSFVDVAKLEALTASQFSTSAAYAIGDVVIYEGTLYKFTSAHAAGAWDSSEVVATNTVTLIADAEPDSLTTEQINALLAILG